MRYTITIPQAGIHAAGLLGRVSLESWILLGACARFFFCAKSDRLPSDDGGAPYVWFNIPHALDEIPLLWPTRGEKSRRNRASSALKELIEAGLLKTRRGARGRLYVRPTPLALELEYTPTTVPKNRDGTVPEFRDGETPVVTKQGTRINEHGDAHALEETQFTEFWKSYPKRTHRLRALRAWRQTARFRPQFDTLLAALEVFKSTDDWTKAGGKFVPLCSTWLNDRRWTEVEPDAPKPPAQPEPEGWREALARLYPHAYEPASWADLLRDHPDIAAELKTELTKTP